MTPFDLGQCRRHAASCMPEGSPRRRVELETLLMFLVLTGSFALVGLLIPFADNILRPVDDMAAADHHDNLQA